ncbi:hypothetical protein GBA52_017310 [Prunus armeniaca]|nr:hypothetical protein GBA52_017310 [Prunus armeniaca]
MIVPSIKDDCLMVRDNVVLSHVPRNITIAPAADEAALIGASSSNSSFRHGIQVYVSLQIQALVDDTEFLEIQAVKFQQKLKCSSWKQEKNPLSKMGYLSQQLRTVCRFCHYQSWMDHSGLVCKGTL